MANRWTNQEESKGPRRNQQNQFNDVIMQDMDLENNND
jgi:hypothetical protein